MGSPGNGTPGNPVRIPLPPSEFATSPRAPSLRIDGQSNKARSQAGTLMSPKPSERVMVRDSLRSSFDMLNVVMSLVPKIHCEIKQ